MNPKIRELILDNALAVWLNADYDILLERVSRKKTRPLLERGNKAEILMELMNQRTPFYEMAHIKVTSDNRPHQEMIKELKKQIVEYTQKEDI